MLRIAKDPQFTHKVVALVPVDGGHEEQEFRVRFRAISISDDEAHDTATAEGMTAYLHKIVVSMEDLADENGNPIAYNDQVRDAVLSQAYARLAIYTTYVRALTKARVGN